MLAMLLLVAGGGVGAANATSNASPTTVVAASQAVQPTVTTAVRVAYDTVPMHACQEQGHAGASVWNPYANGWWCYGVDFAPPFVTNAGMVDFPAYCSRHYPDSQATNRNNSVFGWKCERIEQRDI